MNWKWAAVCVIVCCITAVFIAKGGTGDAGSFEGGLTFAAVLIVVLG